MMYAGPGIAAQNYKNTWKNTAEEQKINLTVACLKIFLKNNLDFQATMHISDLIDHLEMPTSKRYKFSEKIIGLSLELLNGNYSSHIKKLYIYPNDILTQTFTFNNINLFYALHYIVNLCTHKIVLNYDQKMMQP